MKKINILKIGLIWYAITLVFYGILLNIFKEYELLSTLYHVLLLFPLVLIILKKETLKDIGFRKGVINISALLLVFGLPILMIIAQIFVFHNPINIILNYAFFLFVIISPVTEEVFFRGFLQEKIQTISNRRYMAIIIVGLLFACIHLPRLFIGMYSIGNLIFVFILGLMFGWVYSEGKSIVYPVMFHLLWNLSLSIF